MLVWEMTGSWVLLIDSDFVNQGKIGNLQFQCTHHAILVHVAV